VIVRCTAKALKLLDARPVSSPPGDDDWYVNVVWLNRRKSLLLTHASTLFPVFVADVRKSDLVDLGSWLGNQVVEALKDEDLPTDVLGDLHSTATVCKTASRRILGYMNQTTLEIEDIVAGAGGLHNAEINEMNRWLRRSLHSIAGGPEYAAPIELVRSRV
jgi:hypothetical protein